MTSHVVTVAGLNHLTGSGVLCNLHINFTTHVLNTVTTQYEIHWLQFDIFLKQDVVSVGRLSVH